MRHALARTLSILGHPLVVMPASVLVLAAVQGRDARALSAMALALFAMASVVMGWSAWQVRRGGWTHVDASAPSERRGLNRFLLAMLLLSTALAWSTQREVAIGLALSAVVVGSGLLTARWLHLSLHVAFAVYAAVLLLRIGWPACAAGLVFACAVAWSRLSLRRHVLRDVLAGAAAGALAGVAFWKWMPQLLP